MNYKLNSKLMNSIELAKLEARAKMQQRAELAARRIERKVKPIHDYVLFAIAFSYTICALTAIWVCL